jgi:hypothetical protein
MTWIRRWRWRLEMEMKIEKMKTRDDGVDRRREGKE